jgi:lipoyl(octanoyl) transferase
VSACRLLPLVGADGPWQMAADQALLESAADAGAASLRFYTWPRATLSLGYFQPEVVRHSDARLEALPWVRRPSGGEALVHDREVTYALALPPGAPWQRRGESWLWRMHGIIAEVLADLGVTARPCGEGEGRRLGEVLCFLHQTPADLLVGGAKVVGSAQRKQRGALMQHGGILLAASPAAPQLPGVEELTGRLLTPQEVAAAVAGRFGRATGAAVEPGDWSDAERRRIAELVATRYTQPAWNSKR